MSGSKKTRFGNKYGFFLSDASNEEVVSISKELTDEFSAQTKTVNCTALALLAISMGSMFLAISMVMDTSSVASTGYKNVLFLMRMIGIAFLCLSALVAALVVQKAMKVSSFSALIWRHIRETASDENTYEQINVVKTINFELSSAKSMIVTGSMMIVFSGIFLGFSYVIQMMAASGYL